MDFAKADDHSKNGASYLESCVDSVTANFLVDEQREAANKLACEFLKTAALFTPGRAGFVASGLMHGLAQARPDDTLDGQALDMSLGAAKGTALKYAFSQIGTGKELSPMHGVFLGAAGRSAETIFQRDLFTNPLDVQKRLGQELMNPTAIAHDAIVFGATQGMFSAANRLSRGALARNEMLASVSMAGTMGVVSGGTGELLRQQQSGEQLDIAEVLSSGLKHGAVNALAGGLATRMGRSVAFEKSSTISEKLPERALDAHSLNQLSRAAHAELLVRLEQSGYLPPVTRSREPLFRFNEITDPAVVQYPEPQVAETTSIQPKPKSQSGESAFTPKPESQPKPLFEVPEDVMIFTTLPSPLHTGWRPPKAP